MSRLEYLFDGSSSVISPRDISFQALFQANGPLFELSFVIG